MFLESKDFLTIWDIAHRWADLDADATQPGSLPVDVKYWIQKIVLGYFAKDLVLRRKDGRSVPDDDLYLVLFNLNIWRTRLWKCLEKDVFDKPFLKSIYVMRSQVITWCAKEYIDPPEFWAIPRGKPEPAEKPTINNRSPDERVDRYVCQAIALTYWDIDKRIPPAHMAKAKAIGIYGNGKQYTDPNTVNKWISDVDPLKGQRKPGRPPDISYRVDLETGELP